MPFIHLPTEFIFTWLIYISWLRYFLFGKDPSFTSKHIAGLRNKDFYVSTSMNINILGHKTIQKEVKFIKEPAP